MAAENIFKLKLESIAAGGEALGRLEGKPVFVEGGAPDETVVCRVTEEHKTWARAELLEIVVPSAVRTAPACAFYGKCGGCNLQHINYEAQLAAKTGILKDSFARIGGFSTPEPQVFKSPQWGCRNRMQFHCLRESAGNGRVKFGLKGRASSEIIAVTDCPVAEAGIRGILGGNGEGIPLPPEKDRFTVFSKDGLLLSEGSTQRGKITLLGKEVALDAGVFFQSNIRMLEELIPHLRNAAEAAGSGPMADLYCGVGTFAVFLGGMFPKIALAEENKKAVCIARENLRGMEAEFFAIRDTQWEKPLLRRKEKFSFAVIDPPRAGLAAPLAQALAREGPPLLAYVSCDAAALARDRKILADSYSLKELKLFDFYPQTSHIEILAVFVKR